jgi:hypothetical protein
MLSQQALARSIIRLYRFPYIGHLTKKRIGHLSKEKIGHLSSQRILQVTDASEESLVYTIRDASPPRIVTTQVINGAIGRRPLLVGWGMGSLAAAALAPPEKGPQPHV